ncbi:RNA polymerase sigma factor [Olleya sp. R77988]|uniref:RNA polymerase sigma factor n=1 Tax=Olleya sp. R77988 TaxID=3093875 RepID=UPI0037C7C82C
MQNDDFIRLFLKGDQKTLNSIYKNSFQYVKHYITSRDGTEKDAEDVFHNALIILYVKLKAKEIKVQSFNNYFFTVCKNLWKRENSKKRVTNIDTIPLVSEELDLAAFYLEHSQWELYKEKFELLSSQCKEILKMVFEKKSYKEIVKKYDYSSQLVARQRVFKCKTKLTQLIKKDNRFSKLK